MKWCLMYLYKTPPKGERVKFVRSEWFEEGHTPTSGHPDEKGHFWAHTVYTAISDFKPPWKRRVAGAATTLSWHFTKDDK